MHSRGGYAECASQLKAIAAAYASLETIELIERSGARTIHRTQQKVEECLGEEFIKPKLLWTTQWQGAFPEYMATPVSFVKHYRAAH